jgi:hypothetical protein
MSFKVHPERYEIALVKPSDKGAHPFAVVDYLGERTIIRALQEGEVAFEGRNFNMISFLEDMPLDTVGFLALVSAALSERGIPIFVISSYRTDHILVIEQDIGKCVETLRALGMRRE